MDFIHKFVISMMIVSLMLERRFTAGLNSDEIVDTLVLRPLMIVAYLHLQIAVIITFI
jgi:hypothetical protein